MLTRRLRERVPSAQAVGVAVLAGHERRWHKRSRDGSTKCDVVPTDRPGAVVHGVLFAMDASDKPALDAAEGLGAGYDEVCVVVTCGQVALACQTYVATDIDAGGLPYAWYRDLVVAGAREHGLPAATLEALAAQAVQADADAARQARNLALLRDDAGQAPPSTPAAAKDP